MSMTEYTPTTKAIRDCYVFADEGLDGSLRSPERLLHAEFDRWLAGVKADAWDEGKRAEEIGWTHVYDGHPVREGETCDECIVSNPYRSKEVTDAV